MDPKFDTPSRWARENGFPVLHPQRNRSKSDFVSEINENLKFMFESYPKNVKKFSMIIQIKSLNI